MDRPTCVIVDGVRTPCAEWVGGKRGDGKPGGALRHLSANQLGALAAREVMKRTSLDPGDVDHVIFGHALQTGRDALYGTRHVALGAGVPVATPSLTVNRLCGSGIQSIISSVHCIQLGEARIVLAGGMESMSQAPHVLWGARSGYRFGDGKLEDLLLLSLKDPWCDLYMAQTAEGLARSHSISREEQDRLAFESQQKAATARDRGFFEDEVFPVSVEVRGREMEFREDDHVRPSTTLDGLARLPAAFSRDGTVTPGNASGIVDGAAAVVVTSEEEARSRGWTAMARICAWSVVGVEPSVMGIGPVPAIRKLLGATGLSREDIHRFEINEAFAAQYLAVEKELGLDRSKVNVNGGAIAIGHPLGATGTRLVITLARELKLSGLRYGVASACIGGGQGIAMLLENPDTNA